MGQVKSRRRGLTKSKANTDEKSNYDKTGKKTKDNPACINDILVDDVLLKIFSFLTVFEKLTVSRACKRWNTLMKEPQLWHKIDFHRERRNDEYSIEEGTEERCTLAALKTYARFLKRVYLHVVTIDILHYVTNNCPHLQTLSIMPSGPYQQMVMWYLCKRGEENCEFIRGPSFVLPSTLRKLQLSFSMIDPRLVEDPFECNDIAQRVLNTVSHCDNLYHLTLMECAQLHMLLVPLARGVPNLRELWLLKFTTDPSDSNTNFQEILCQIVRSLKDLKSLRFIPRFRQIAYIPAIIIGPSIYVINDILCKQLGQLRDLKDFGIGDVRFSLESFIILTSTLIHLEELTLRNCDCVTDEILSFIAKDLPCLKMLDLTGSRPYTDKGLIPLQYHPSLQIIKFYRPSDIPFQSYAGLFETFVTLPKLEQVKGLGAINVCNADIRTYFEQLLSMKPNVKLDIKIEEEFKGQQT
ncbi:F-box and leucine-rich repeat protein 13-like [Amphiura filiformis]|uniref:F-box and leucine-rich repeat protein 13-like n=1 Tax=Amphiura filiformis TaxID=82378 RepID=UPI003B21A9EB